MYSSNIGTVHMVMDAGTAVQQDFLGRLGLLQAASVELSEVGQPMVPSPWREINTMTISYGHGLAVSTLQMTAAVAAIVNGGSAVTPTMLLQDRASLRPAAPVTPARPSAQLRTPIPLGAVQS